MDLFSADLPEQGDQPAGVATSAGTSHEPDGAVRSWPDAGDTAAEAGGAGAGARKGTRSQGAGLSAMLLPELQRVAQSEGITGTAKMRKGQLIAAIEERRQGGEAGAAGQRGGGLRADASPDHEPKADQVKTSGNSVQRGAPAGAGADRTFEQDAMESQTSTQPGLGGTAAGGIGETQGYESGVGSTRTDSAPASNGATASAAANGSAGEPAQQAGDGQRSDRRRRGNARRDEDGEQPRAASDGQDSDRDGDSGGRQGNRDQQGGGEQGNRGQGNRGQGNRDQQGGGEQGNRGQGNRGQGNRDQGNRDQGNRDQGNRDQGGGRDD